MDSQVAQTNTNLQQSRNDLQPTNNALQQGGGVSGASNALPQEQLNAKSLRVGDSTTTVQNTTTATPHTSETQFSFLWVWLGLLVVVALGIFFLMRRRLATVEAIEPAQDGPDVGVPKPKTAKKKSKQPGKSRGAAKRKYQR